MLSVALVAISCGSDVVFVVLALEDVDGVAIEEVAEFLLEVFGEVCEGVSNPPGGFVGWFVLLPGVATRTTIVVGG